jgi:hypothetical protein
MNGDPSLNVLLRPAVPLLFRKDNTLVHRLVVLMPLERVSKMRFVSVSAGAGLTASWIISLQPRSSEPKL